MAYRLLTTAGDNAYLDPGSTFPTLADGDKAKAEHRDELDRKIYSDIDGVPGKMGFVSLDPSTGYSVAFLDSGGKISEMALTTEGVFPEWVADRLVQRASLGIDGGDPSLEHEARKDEFTHNMGFVNTGGKGAVALRFDHGLANFNTKIRPLLEARNLPYSLALNSRAWNLPENDGVDAGVVNHWVSQGLAEVWNHGADHTDHPIEELADIIIEGKRELESQLPSAKIWGFAPPGVGGGNYAGFNAGASPDSFGTPAARIILQSHAVCSGYMPGTSHRLLDGRLRMGSGHYTLDSSAATSSSAAKSQLNSAVANRTGLQLMMHPSLIDSSGMISTTILTEILDHIVSLRDSGSLKVLSPYQLTVANSQLGS